LEFTEHGSDKFFRLHCPAGRPSGLRRRFQRHDQPRILVVFLRLVRVLCLVPLPERQQQLHQPQLRPPGKRLLGALLQGLGLCVEGFYPLTIAPDRRERARSLCFRLKWRASTRDVDYSRNNGNSFTRYFFKCFRKASIKSAEEA